MLGSLPQFSGVLILSVYYFFQRIDFQIVMETKQFIASCCKLLFLTLTVNLLPFI